MCVIHLREQERVCICMYVLPVCVSVCVCIVFGKRMNAINRKIVISCEYTENITDCLLLLLLFSYVINLFEMTSAGR